MSDYPLSKYSAKIKDVYIELKNYKFFHSPYDESVSKHRFIGRKKVKNRINSILDNTDVKSGSYLITGFRGMGKTSVVRESLNEFNNKQKGSSVYKDFRDSLDLFFSEYVKMLRIFLCSIFVYFILYLLRSDLFDFDRTKVIQSYILFSIVFLIVFLLGLFNLKRRVFIKFGISILPVLNLAIPIYFLEADEGWVNYFQSLTRNVWEIILLISFFIIAATALRSDEVFEAIWNYFKVAFIVLVLLISTIFFFDYKYIFKSASVCEEVKRCNWVKEGMDKFFPVITFQKNSAPGSISFSNTNRVTVTQFDDSNKLSNTSNAGENQQSNSMEADVFTVIFRIIVSILFSYILLSTIVFLIDLIYLARLKTFQVSKNKKSKKYKYFEINLSQDSLDEMEILRRMTINIEDYWKEQKFALGNILFNRKFYFVWNFIISRIDRPRKNQFKPSYKTISEKLNLLKNRMSGHLTTRRERKASPHITTPIAGLVEFSMPLSNATNNDEIAFQIASVKEAEDLLREILDEIDKLREDANLNFEIPQFVFIIDELDKIDPHNSSVIQERESSNPVLDNSIYADDTNRFRQRREAVSRLLANLKGFLNVVKAKFFFIGGREMFDADLADIADRESFYSSIFNDVIYVESFFKDSAGADFQGTGGITQMTETYICNLILNDLKSRKDGEEQQETSNSEEQYEADKLNLKELHKKLISVKGKSYLKFKSNEAEKSADESDEFRKQKFKLLSTLQNYIVYLTYRSSGTPKKLTNLSEQLIVRVPKAEKKDRIAKNKRFFEDNLVVLHNDVEEDDDLSEKLFLKFGFNTQYEIGLTSNLYRPYLIANSRHLKSLGDKLLFSSAFIIDHILKFHPFGFSWRNLELIPEVVLVNREPNLRDFIEELMRFYSLNYIRDTVSGIFDYRFRSIIRRELIHLSKTSDLSAAAFNFTLDESLAIKRHYKRKLLEYQKNYQSYEPSEGDNLFVHSIYFLQSILGDLHFYDKEYDEAILFYTESIQSLRLPNAITDRKITRHQFLLWVKNKLKLGLSLEKIRAFDSAFSIYRTLTLDSERYFKNIVSKENSGPKDANKTFYFYEKNRTPVDGNQTREAEDHRAIHVISMPFVALLAVAEKFRLDGITYTNLFTNRKDFKRTINFQDGEENIPDKDDELNKESDTYRKFYLLADYYNNVGSVLYYKNCQFTRFFQNENYLLEAFDKEKLKHPVIIRQNDIYTKTEAPPYDFFPSLSAFNYYWNSLYFLLKYHQKRLAEAIGKKDETKPKDKDSLNLEDNLLALCTGYLLPECIDMASSNRLYYIANVISKIGDSILASLNKNGFDIPVTKNEEGFIIPNKFNALDITAWAKIAEKNREDNIKWFRENLGQNLFTAETVLYAYKLAAALYKRAGYNAYYASSLTRILYVIKDLIGLNKEKTEEIKNFLAINDKEPFRKIEEIAETVFRATTWNNEVSNRPQILKYREILDISINKDQDRELIYNIINNISDSKEVIVLVESIKIKLIKIFGKEFKKDYFTIGKTINSAYGTMSSRYQRMLELKYRTERCFYILYDVLKLSALFDKNLSLSDSDKTEEEKSEINEQISTIIQNKEVIEINDVVAFLIHEALFCSSQLIKKIKLYNPGYVIGFSFIAEAHGRMGDWCQAYDNYLKIIHEKHDLKNKFDERIKDLLGSDSLIYLESKNHYESAIQYYYKMIQMHSDGKTYKDKLHEIYMLEDDYNDSMAHYTIAAERVRINTGTIKDKINDLNKKIADSRVYVYNSYLTSSKDDLGELSEKVKENYLKFFNEKISPNNKVSNS